jgi:ABC-type cobalamin/Fe3+-siderophores transport system ATPase subunit
MELCIENLCKRYPNGVQALQDVTLTIPTGMFGLLGPNGAGKSTLMRTVATLQEADAGRVALDGFPNTIPYSEAIGFIARVDPNDPDDIDYPYYVTAHEVAHQWWAHQVIGGNVQGATMLSETLAQYSALMVMKQKFGGDQMRSSATFLGMTSRVAPESTMPRTMVRRTCSRGRSPSSARIKSRLLVNSISTENLPTRLAPPRRVACFIGPILRE